MFFWLILYLFALGQVRCRILILLLRSFAIFVHGGMSVIIFSHLGSCHLASLSRDIVFGLYAFELVVVGIGGFEVGCLLWHHLFGRCCRIGERVEILLSLIAVFCFTISRWMSSGGIAILISSV
jgi:hypothetical protein